MDQRAGVPWRAIWALIFSVVLTLAALQVLGEITRIISWMVVALFFTVVLNPAVDFLQQRGRMRRGVATAVVMVAAMALLGGMLYIFISPLVEQGQKFAADLPNIIEDAREGRGAIGRLVERYNLEDWVNDNQEQITDFARNLGTPALTVLLSLLNGVVAALTIFVLTVLLLLQGPNIADALITLIPDRHQRRVRAVARDSARAVSGYISGNLIISIIAGLATWAMLAIVGVPYAAVIGLFVAFCDLIPLVGATLGAIPTIGFAFLHSTTAGVTAVIFYIVYQQVENHILGVAIMSRTVRINPLAVLLSVLISVELFGFLGALLAVPAAGIIQVIVRDLYDERTGRLKLRPTTGTDEIEVADVPPLHEGDGVDRTHEKADGKPIAGTEVAPAPD